ncbi:MAG TPA: DUF3119 family protein [Geminocystis sp. M7585_C2015_104]|nr:DUF3119 family protein [Geminocystis sp. M7585_C2015_104]
MGVALTVFLWWLGLLLTLFGIFLFLQTSIIRLRFTPTALEVYRGGAKIRVFPYQDWENWLIFWPGLPIIFYFKEVKSIHLLPIIFDAVTLQECLETHVPAPRRQ